MALQCSQSGLFFSQTAHPTNVSKSLLGWNSKTWTCSVRSGDKQMRLLQWKQQQWKHGLRERSDFAMDFLLHNLPRRTCKTTASALIPSASQAASSIFTLGTVFVVPFYTVMILAPRAEWTRKLVESNIPYVVLGILYLYLLSLSWTSETLQLMFASKYWLPELHGITKMFSSTVTVASAWIHLLAVDLFAGRQVFLDGLQHAVETRHSLVLCLLFCPVGILSHFITKMVMRLWRRVNNEEESDVARLYS